ncbi:exonuclease domain-containing protein [Gilvimarinus sp. DA14]|uniref:exonuclease domain-containing protein n=1 Tax=Gilvimarinus sp. DA14 TaxID=2956798 RepID=UPI0020B66304|nr:exonuclease domain-containing protein [Gilvimarinus sp. DA14]UTF60655.1 exonuclease domain-containing protein [Gilvimarinus sp. DA14]
MTDTLKQSFFPGLNGPLAIVDIETTGGNVTRDRITEIGIVTVDDKGVHEWSTLINPGMAIPKTVQALTGIDNEMVADAPRFEQVAKQIWLRLEGKVFIAHNVRFDYGFIRNAFADLGFPVQLNLLCTVKLSRALYPEFKRHGLEAIIQRFDIPTSARHRALADARATYHFLTIAQQEKTAAAFMTAVQGQTRRPSLPPGLEPGVIERLPNTPGVYYFYGDNDNLLYIGKSINVRKRVMSHFSADKASAKAMAMCQQIRDIQAEPTTGELSALLLESAEIKKHQPIFNRRLRRLSKLYTLQLQEDDAGLLRPHILPVGEAQRQLKMYGLFPSQKKARNALLEAAKPAGLCDHVVLTDTPAVVACMGWQLNRCRGLCTGSISTVQHNVWMMESLAKLALQAWPYPGPVCLLEHAQNGEQYTAFLIDNWCLLASQSGIGEPDMDDLRASAAEPALDRDLYRYLSKAILKGAQQTQLIPL